MKVIEVRENVFADNTKTADVLRKQLSDKGTYMINVMSSPGSGKTTLLTELINNLKDKLSIALMDVDIETDIDAKRVANGTNVPCIQIHNGGLCHIDAEMTSKSIIEANFDNVDLLVLENIGNLVCPAEFDTGAHLNMMLLSIPEGDDKPLKYPLMFSVSDLIVITKIDTKPAFDFDIEKCTEYIRNLNPKATILTVSAKSGEGMKELTKWMFDKVSTCK